jgi:hypothetical protein
MSCSADYYFEWNGRLGTTLQAKPKRQKICNSEPKKMRENILMLTLEALTSRCYQHWQHRLFGAYNALQS